jgi:hypothetical protein
MSTKTTNNKTVQTSNPIDQIDRELVLGKLKVQRANAFKELVRFGIVKDEMKEESFNTRGMTESHKKQIFKSRKDWDIEEKLMDKAIAKYNEFQLAHKLITKDLDSTLDLLKKLVS